VPEITCPLCRRTVESGPEHCPRCHIRLPGASPLPKAPASRIRRASSDRAPRRAASPTRAVSLPNLQCPACAHPITRDARWCAWCKWPVNRE